MRLILPLFAVLACNAATPDGGGAKSPAPTDTGDSLDTGDGETDGACVTGALRSERTLGLNGVVGQLNSDQPQAGVAVRLCGTGPSVITDTTGVWAVDGPDAEWVTIEASADDAFPTKWVYDPSVEGSGDAPLSTDLISPALAAMVFSALGEILDPATALVVVDAMDPDTREELAGARVETEPPGAGAFTVSPEGQPILDDTTNGIHDVAVFGVPPGPVALVITAPDGRACRVAPPVRVEAGTVLGIATYCR